MTNGYIGSEGKNIQEKASVIWDAANTLFGAFKPHEYGLVILPMCVIKRFDDCLIATKEKVLETYKKIGHLAVRDGFLCGASGYPFYNTSSFTFQSLKADPENIEDNFRAYLNGFSDNVQDILARMGFSSQVDRMVEAGCLYQIIVDFSSPKADMGPEHISAVDMGYVFENLVQRFSESYNEEAGAHFTSRDIIYTMCDLLTAEKDNIVDEDGVETVYDMTMGTSQMLTCMVERLRQMNEDVDVATFGQEFNPFTFGIAKADALIRGEDADNMRFGDTLNNDQFEGYHFDYCISNPPFGIDWKREAAAVEAEAKKGAAGRFGPGLPPKSDGQMLFMLNGIAKLKDDGRMAIIQNGSSLFTGDAGSGPSEIRKYIIENDWLDAIVQLPTNAFYNTPITTYVWLIMKHKPAHRRGRVQLIDASACSMSRRKNIGSKNTDITPNCRNLIVNVYGKFIDGTFEGTDENGGKIVVKSKVIDTIDFGYSKIVVESPATDENGNIIMKKGKPVADTSKRDTENVPLAEDVDAYFEREVLPYNPNAWIDTKKTQVGYEIPFTRTFYEYKQVEPSDVIAKRIEEHEKSLMAKLHDLFGEG